jgi:hypothetical protein
MSTSVEKELPPGTQPIFANMHKWLGRGLFACLTALVREGTLTVPLMAVWMGWPTLSLVEICSELDKVRFADESRECLFPYPLFGPPEGRGQTTSKDKWGPIPTNRAKVRIGYRDLVRFRDERLARQVAAAQKLDESAAAESPPSHSQ